MKSMSMCVGRVLRSATPPRAKGAPWRAAHTASAGFVSVLPPRSSSAAVAVGCRLLKQVPGCRKKLPRYHTSPI